MSEELYAAIIGGLIGLMAGLVTTFLTLVQSQIELEREECRYKEELERERQRRQDDLEREDRLRKQNMDRDDRLHEASVIADDIKLMYEIYRDLPDGHQQRGEIMARIEIWQERRRGHLDATGYLQHD